jgi:hypothetical protein
MHSPFRIHKSTSTARSARRHYRKFSKLRSGALIAVAFYCFGTANTTMGQSYAGVDLYVIQSLSGDPVYFPNGSGEIAAGGQVVGYPVNLAAPGGGGLPGDGLLWTPPVGAVVDLTPAGGGETAHSTDGVHQVGDGALPMIGGDHALLWSGTAASVVDLHPTNLSGFVTSQAYGVSGVQQVGVGQIQQGTQVIEHALRWNGTAASAVDLHPTNLTGFDSSVAYATDGIHQVGTGGGSGTGGHNHALLWSGSATSAVDLHPTNLTGYSDTFAFGVGGGQQVGSAGGAVTGGQDHAMLWNGTANSAVDLNPGGSVTSIAYATNGVHQVGGSDFGATLWSGTAASAVDLNSLLPFASDSSTAYTIDPQGNVFGIADGPDGLHAVEWSPVPEPAAAVLFVAGAIGIIVICRRIQSW